MQDQGNGSIINISTFAAFEPDPLFPTSGVFRAGLAAFSKLYADKYAIEGIRMNNVLPGFIDSLPETEDRKARIPMGRYGNVTEVSSLISWLASDDGALYDRSEPACRRRADPCCLIKFLPAARTERIAFIIKWVASVIQIMGYTATAFGWTPWNLYLFLIGVLGWGHRRHPVGTTKAIMLIHIVALFAMLAGMAGG